MVGVTHLANVGSDGIRVDNDKRLLLRLELELKLFRTSLKASEPATMAAVDAIGLKLAKTF